MPSQDEVNQFQDAIARLAEISGTTAADIWNEINDPDELAVAYPEAVDPYINASSIITAEWYDGLSDARFVVEPAAPVPLETLRYKAEWAAAQPDPAAALNGATDRLVFQASHDTILDNAEREGVRYARHAQPDACAWCSILATRQHLQHNNVKKSHDHCHCILVPVRDGDYYDEPDYVAGWRQEYESAAAEVGTKKKGLDPIANAMERKRHAANPEPQRAYAREYYAENKEQITAQQRKRYANTKTYPDQG
jgi:hypothetical protein